MSRPKPQIILDHTTPAYKSTQVLASDGIYAVFYNGEPINLRSLEKLKFNKRGESAGPKYRKVSFSNSGHAFNLCAKLNQLYKTTSFEVYFLTNGQIITKKS